MAIQRWRGWCGLLLVCGVALADGPQDNLADKVRRIPPPGVPLTASDRQELEAATTALGLEIAELRSDLQGKAELLELLPDVQVYYNAVYYALKYHEFHNPYDKKKKPSEVAVARKLLEQGRERAKQLRAGQAPWTTAPGLIVRGYISKIDGSVQPYGLVVPKSYQAGSPRQHRLDIWFHGRGETLSELSFINGRQNSAGEFAPPHAFVLHPYGRYCNANHFAGEIDTLEALEHVQKHYSIDEDRVVVRGFSMGGAACWNFAVHYSSRWAAAAPGAGFSETPDFLLKFQGEKIEPNVWERKLLHWYDCTDWALNLANCPTVAYSGEIDKQKQAADIMAKALRDENIDLVHIIGPNTGHKYHPAAKVEISRRIDRLAARGRDAVPTTINLTTWTLLYPRMFWVQVEGLGKHWERARVRAEVSGDDSINVTTSNVTALTLDMPPGGCPLDATKVPHVDIDTQEIELRDNLIGSDRSWTVHLHKQGERWQVGKLEDGTLRKRPGLQGPIDHAFMDRFVMVRPTGKARHEQVGRWIDAEMQHAIEHWRRQFRAELLPKDDMQVSDEDIASSNLILWGDPAGNRILAKIADKLPIAWEEGTVRVGAQSFDANRHVPVLIYPNPLNPQKYVVLNSGFTFREYDYLNNARQIPRLPDWAVLDITQPRTSRQPAGIAAAGFFGERWEVTR
jgi:pimeloyl-ACP methyl ester carboxylesterase